MSDPNEPSNVTAGKFTKNAIFAIGSQVTIRFIGLVSVVIMARLLTPQDFGLVSIALSSVFFAEILTYVGVKAALISHPNPTREDYDTAWTIQLIVNLAMGAGTYFAIAPLAADFFQREELTLIVRVLSLRFVFIGMRNIGIVDFERNLTLNLDFYMRGLARLVSFFITIGVAFYVRNYWALITGVIVMPALWTLLSYKMNDFRPRFCLTLWRHYCNYSLWMLVSAIAGTARSQIERITLGRLEDSHVTGLYATSQDLARIFTSEIVTSIGRVTLPSFAKYNAEDASFIKHIPTAFGAYAAIAAPCAVGISATAGILVPILLGGQWNNAAPLLEIIVIAAGLNAIWAPLRSILLARGQVRDQAIINVVFSALLVAPVIIIARQKIGVIAIAQTVVAVNFLILFISLTITTVKFRVAFTDLLFAIGRPCLAAIAMYYVVISLPGIENLPTILALIAQVATGAAVYTVLLLSIWGLSGKPDGAESIILREVLKRLKL